MARRCLRRSPRTSGAFEQSERGWFTWCAEQLDQAHRDLLAELPLTVSLDVDGLGPVCFCHGSGRDDNKFVLVDSPLDLYRDAFAAVSEQIVVLGHTHIPFDRLAGRRRFVNAGSVGLGYGHRGASWALLGPDITLRRTEYDANAAANLILASSGLPGADDVAANIREPDSDRAALAAFTETVEQQQHG